MIRNFIITILAAMVSLSVYGQTETETEPVSLEVFLQSRGLTRSDDPDVHRAWLTSILNLYDPFGEVATQEELDMKAAERVGQVTGLGWTLASTGSWFSVESDENEMVPPGSVVLRIGEKSTTNISYSALQNIIRTLPDEEVNAKFKNPEGELEDVSLKPSPSSLPVLALKENLPEQLGYLRINGLYDGAEKEVLKVLRSWTETDCYGLILDLRQASGTNLDAVEKIASLFVPEGEFLFAYRTLEDQDLEVRKAVAGGPINQPVMVLMDGKTSGASEALAAVLAGAGRGVMILGQPSAGDPLIRESVLFDDPYYLYVTSKKLVTADGREYLGKQKVIPHVVVRTKDGTAPYEPEPGTRETTLEEEAEDLFIRNRVRYDPVMRRAVDVLLGLKALKVRTEKPDETS